MRAILAVLGLISTPALAGGGDMSTTDRKEITSSYCKKDADCQEYLSFQNVVSASCKIEKYSRGKCVLNMRYCHNAPNHIATWNHETKKCHLTPAIPELGIMCYNDSDCPQGGGVASYNDAQVSMKTRCITFNEDYNFGICHLELVDASCCAWGIDTNGVCLPQSKYCFSNNDCYADKQVCHNNQCQTPSFSQEVGDGNVCDTLDDCGGDMISWGKLCVPTLFASSTGKLCQECKPDDSTNVGIDPGCTAERPNCKWGASWNDKLTAESRSYYSCHPQ